MNDSNDGVVILFTATAKPGKEAALKEMFANVITQSRRDTGNLLYELHEVEGDPASLVLYEWWASDEMLQAHMASRPLQELKEKFDELAVGTFQEGQKRLRRTRPSA